MKEIEKALRRTSLETRLKRLVNRIMKRVEKGEFIVPNEEGLRRLLLYTAHEASKIAYDAEMGKTVEWCHEP